MLTIGTLAKRTGVKIPTIRYYESVGILTPPARTEGNQRRYTTADVERLHFVKHARNLGFSIESIKELIALSLNAERSCASADVIAKTQLREVRDRIQKLKKLEKELHRIATSCNGHDVGHCYVIQALSDHKLCATEH